MPHHAFPSTNARALMAMVCALSAGSAPVLAADAAAGRTKAQQVCAVCHGQLGISTAPDAPHLAGQPAIYLSAQLRAYRDGRRKHEVMGVIAKTLGDEDIANLAGWFAALRIEVHEPR